MIGILTKCERANAGDWGRQPSTINKGGYLTPCLRGTKLSHYQTLKKRHKKEKQNETITKNK